MKNPLPEYFSPVSAAVDVLRYLFPVQAMVHGVHVFVHYVRYGGKIGYRLVLADTELPFEGNLIVLMGIENR